ncbi:terpenoid synthase [Trametes elegans]|nr:terpenoid synthase [Trametes elegans]
MAIVSEHPRHLSLWTGQPVSPPCYPVGEACTAAELERPNSMTICQENTKDPLGTIQKLVREFLYRCPYDSPRSKPDKELRHWLSEQATPWDAELPPGFLSQSIDACCIYVETAYAHNPPEHRRYIALYTLCMAYVDDLGQHDPSAIMQFTRRFVAGERQPNEVLECLVELLRQAHSLWPQFGADSIISGTLDALATAHVENTTRTMAVNPFAKRYPTYLRMKAGVAAPYTHFIFANDWLDIPQFYLQIIPEIDYWTLGANDILSFYKEEIAGETNNCVHMRATVEQVPVNEALSRIVEDVLDTAQRITAVTADDGKLSHIWKRYMHGYLDFHFLTPRYRLGELGLI